MKLREQIKLLNKNNKEQILQDIKAHRQDILKENKILTVFLKYLNIEIEKNLKDKNNYIQILHIKKIAPLIHSLNFDFYSRWTDHTTLIINKKILKQLNKLLKFYSYKKYNITEEEELEYKKFFTIK